MNAASKLTAQLLLTASAIAFLGTPIFVYFYYPEPSLAYEFGAVWNILVGLLAVGLAAAVVTDFTVRRQRASEATHRVRFAASASGPAIVFAPSLAVAGLTTGWAGAAFVLLISAAASVAFWFIAQQFQVRALCRKRCRRE